MPKTATKQIDHETILRADYSSAPLLGDFVSHMRYGGLGGLYIITCIPAGRFYVGSSGNLLHRLRTHWSALERQTHRNHDLRTDAATYGCDSIHYKVIDIEDDGRKRILKESRLIDAISINSFSSLYNTLRVHAHCESLRVRSDVGEWIAIQADTRGISPEAYLDMILRQRMQQRP